MEESIMARIVNIRFKCCGLNFDAAVDCDYQLHAYDGGDHKKVAIEIYCFDHPEWDVCMIFQDGRNDNNTDAIAFTEVNWNGVFKETHKWVREMRKEGNL